MLSEGAPPRACVQADEEVEWVLDRADVQGDRALDREELRTAVTLWRASAHSHASFAAPCMHDCC